MTRPPTKSEHTAAVDRPRPAAPPGGTAAPAAPTGAFFGAVVEHGPLLVMVFDGDSERWRSPAAHRLLGPPTGGGVAELVHPDDRERVTTALADPGSAAEPVEARLRGRDGTWHALSFTVADLRDDPAVRGLVCYGLDVTRTRVAQLRDRHRLAEHNERLAALSALKSDFISIVSHELRTPLSSISSFTELLGGPGELTSPDAPHALAAIARNTDRMLVLLQDLRLLSQLETGDHAVATGAVDVADLLREVGDVVDTGGGLVTVRHDVTDGPLLRGDEQLLRQLVHTVAGTVAACAAGGQMTLRAAADEAAWTVSASAPAAEFITGEQLLAMPLPVLDDASRQRSAALSVLLARAIAQSHGGTLIVEVRAGDTAEIAVRLPFPGAPGASAEPAGHRSAPE